jgi:hypothetical protein
VDSGEPRIFFLLFYSKAPSPPQPSPPPSLVFRNHLLQLTTGMLARLVSASRTLVVSASRGLPYARGSVSRVSFPGCAVPAAQRWGSSNAPATSFLHPPREVEADVQRIGHHGPVKNLDVKDSTVKLSEACKLCLYLSALFHGCSSFVDSAALLRALARQQGTRARIHIPWHG